MEKNIALGMKAYVFVCQRTKESIGGGEGHQMQFIGFFEGIFVGILVLVYSLSCQYLKGYNRERKRVSLFYFKYL